MPLVTCFNLRAEDPLPQIGAAVSGALASMPEFLIDEHEIDFVPILEPDAFPATVARINVDLWERSERTKQGLQEVATRVARAFQATAGSDRRVKVVIRPYAVETSGWVSL